MTAWEFTTAATWGGRPVARRAADARPRCRAVISGTVTSVVEVKAGTGHHLHCTLDDGSGAVTLVFLGRQCVPGMAAGRACTAEGTVQDIGGEMTIWNPVFAVGPDDGG